MGTGGCKRVSAMVARMLHRFTLDHVGLFIDLFRLEFKALLLLYGGMVIYGQEWCMAVRNRRGLGSSGQVGSASGGRRDPSIRLVVGRNLSFFVAFRLQADQ